MKMNDKIKCQDYYSHLSFTLPINKESVFINLEETIELNFSIILLFCPPIKDTSSAQWLRHFNLPIKFKSLRHY